MLFFQLFTHRFTKRTKKGEIICNIIHDIDYDVCGDAIIENDEDFEIDSIKKLNGE